MLHLLLDPDSPVHVIIDHIGVHVHKSLVFVAVFVIFTILIFFSLHVIHLVCKVEISTVHLFVLIQNFLELVGVATCLRREFLAFFLKLAELAELFLFAKALANDICKVFSKHSGFSIDDHFIFTTAYFFLYPVEKGEHMQDGLVVQRMFEL